LRPESIVPMQSQPRPFTAQLFVDFCEFFFPEWPLNFFGLHHSPSNLAESRYLRPGVAPASHSWAVHLVPRTNIGFVRHPWDMFL